MMQSRRALLACLLAGVVAWLPATLRAQRVLGAGEDATVLPGGAFRISVQPSWSHWNERFGSGIGGLGKGEREPLGLDFNLDTLGVAQLENLTSLQTTLRTLTGQPDFGLSLGRMQVTLDATSQRTPVSIELGLTSWFMLGVMVPFSRTRQDVFFSPNPAHNEGNVGVNPALTLDAARQQNGALLGQLAAAASALRDRLASCEQNPAGTGCGAINANRQNALTLLSNADVFAAGVAQVYGTAEAGGALYVPVTGSSAQTAIIARLDAFNTQFQGFLGSGAPAITARPAGAGLPVSLGQAQQIFTNGNTGFGTDALESVERIHIGDVEVGAKLLLLSSLRGAPHRRYAARGFNYRLAIGGLFRAGTAESNTPENLVDIGTGDGQNDIEGRVATDLLFGRRLWFSAVGRYGVQMKDQQDLRILDAPNHPYAARYRQQLVERDLGDYRQLEVMPRFVVNDYFQLSGWYAYYHKDVDRYTGTFDTTDLAGNPITLDASRLDVGSDRTEQRAGFSVSYSTLSAVDRGHGRIPLELMYLQQQVITGDGGAPRAYTSELTLRIYLQAWGRGRR